MAAVHRGAEAGQELRHQDPLRVYMGLGACVTDARSADHLRRHDDLEANPEACPFRACRPSHQPDIHDGGGAWTSAWLTAWLFAFPVVPLIAPLARAAVVRLTAKF